MTRSLAILLAALLPLAAAAEPPSSGRSAEAIRLAAERQAMRRGVTLLQSGRGNEAAVSQSGAGNAALVVQRGRGHSAFLIQDGAGNAATIVQLGRGASVVVTQTGAESLASVQAGR